MASQQNRVRANLTKRFFHHCPPRMHSTDVIVIQRNKFRNCPRKSVLGELRCANSNLGWCGTQCKKCVNGRSWIRLKGPLDLHGQESLRAALAIYASHCWVSTRPPQAVTRENFAKLRTLPSPLVERPSPSSFKCMNVIP